MDGGYMNAFTLLRGEDDKVSTTRLVKKAEAIMAEREAKEEQQQRQQQSNDVVGEYESWDSSSSTIDEEEKESEFEDKSVEEMIMKKKSNKSDDRKKKVGGKSLLKGYGGNPNSKEEKEGRLKKWMRSQRRFLVKHKLWHAVLILWKSFIAFIVIALLMAVLPNKNELQHA
ncbi:hypothetical protein EZV62_004686 [Acer yangbiense]|uniref:Uncharacterized protein n=1 Tax=Acer yangbiense TaxID=1000413 RepID=A0A5C7IKL3_9ROSI|nr:hypothetical protein EZV62_004686 [Acer yangbiense]